MKNFQQAIKNAQTNAIVTAKWEAIIKKHTDFEESKSEDSPTETGSYSIKMDDLWLDIRNGYELIEEEAIADLAENSKESEENFSFKTWVKTTLSKTDQDEFKERISLTQQIGEVMATIRFKKKEAFIIMRKHSIQQNKEQNNKRLQLHQALEEAKNLKIKIKRSNEKILKAWEFSIADKANHLDNSQLNGFWKLVRLIKDKITVSNTTLTIQGFIDNSGEIRYGKEALKVLADHFRNLGDPKKNTNTIF